MIPKSYVDDEEVENIIIIPPDGGWGWVVVTVAFLNNFLIDGIIYTYGLYIRDISEEFEIGIADTAMIGALMTGTACFSGPFVSALLNKFDTRCVCITGSIIASSAYAICSLTVHQYVLLAAYGILLGFGLSMMYIPAIIMPSLYFTKWRALASGIGSTGSGLGTLLLPPIVSSLLKEIGWRHTFQSNIIAVIFAGLLSLAYIPLRPYIVTDAHSKRDLHYSYSNLNLSVTRLQDEDRAKKNCWRVCCFCRHYNNQAYPTTSKLINTNFARLHKDKNTASSRRTMSFFGLESEENMHQRTRSTGFLGSSQRIYLKTISEVTNWDLLRYNCLVCIYSECCEHDTKPMYRDDIFFNNAIRFIPKYKQRAIRMKRKMQNLKKQKLRNRLDKEVEKALRKEEEDAHFTKYHMNVSRVTVTKEYAERPICGCMSIIRALGTLLHLELFKSVTFITSGFVGFLYILGFNIPFMYIVDRAHKAGINDDITFWLLAVIGGANTVGRLMSGILPFVIPLDILILSYAPAIICGASTFCSGFSMEVWFQFLYAAFFGFFGAFMPALRPILIVEIFGLENLTNVFGLQLLLTSIAAFLGPTFAGFLYDETNTYDYSFYFAGSCIVLSGVFLIFIKKIRRWETKNDIVEEEEEEDEDFLKGESSS